MKSLVSEMLPAKGKTITILCGSGNNGGNGLSAARHLFNYGYDVTVVLATNKLRPEPARQLVLIEQMQIPVIVYKEDERHADKAIDQADLLIDALIGYRLQGNPRDAHASLINRANQRSRKEVQLIAYDIPSGVSGAGECLKPCITATATLTIAIPKKIFRTEEGLQHSGDVLVADIGIPEFVYTQVISEGRPNFPQRGLLSIK